MRRLVILIALAACGGSSSNPIDGHGGDGNKTDAPIDEVALNKALFDQLDVEVIGVLDRPGARADDR